MQIGSAEGGEIGHAGGVLNLLGKEGGKCFHLGKRKKEIGKRSPSAFRWKIRST